MADRPPRVGAAVLAAGAGSRFAPGPDAGHKLLAPYRGRTVVWWAAENAARAGLEATWIVQGAVPLHGRIPEGIGVLDNPRWAEGQATSLQRAVAEARSCGLEALVVGLGDQPLIPSSAWHAVASSSADIAVATYHGRRRNPVRLGAAVWDLLPTAGDEGARVLIRARSDLVEDVACDGEPVDIDTREDLATWS